LWAPITAKESQLQLRLTSSQNNGSIPEYASARKLFAVPADKVASSQIQKAIKFREPLLSSLSPSTISAFIPDFPSLFLLASSTWTTFPKFSGYKMPFHHYDSTLTRSI
jgi:hypothetical protein